MSEKLEGAIEEVQRKIRALETELLDYKRTVNLLRTCMQQPPLYVLDAPVETSANSGLTNDSYYGKETAAVIEDILRRRKTAGKGAASVNEIYDAMEAGGYHFQASTPENKKRGIYISLGKNPLFHKLPNGSYGLSEWYPAIKSKPANGRRRDADEEVDDTPPPDAEEFALVAPNSTTAGEDGKPAKPR